MKPFLIALLLVGCASQQIVAPSVSKRAQYATLPLFDKNNHPENAPKVVSRVPPLFPFDLVQRLPPSTAVELEVVVGDDGIVRDAWSVGGDPRLQHDAIVAVRQWRFTPATQDGRPIASRCRMTVSLKHA